MYSHLIADFITLYAIFNPTGIVPSYIYYTRHEPRHTLLGIALRCIIVASGILVLFIVVGQVMLDALGISIAAFGIAGGLLLIGISLKMIFEKIEGTDDPEEEARTTYANLAFFPIGTPLIAGPGGILVVVLLTDNNRYSVPDQVGTTLALLAVMLLTFVALLASGWIQRILGTAGIAVVSRLEGVILAAVAIQTLVSNLKTAFPGL